MPSKVVPQGTLVLEQGQVFLLFPMALSCLLCPQREGQTGSHRKSLKEPNRIIMDDTFKLFDLKVEVMGTERPLVCGHTIGDYFLVVGEDLVFPENNSFSMYALSALLPLLPAKQRPLDSNDWMLSDSLIACPDPNCGARFKITRTGIREFHHGECTVEPIYKGEEA